MKTKTLVSILLLGFVAISVAFAFRKIAPESPTSHSRRLQASNAKQGVAATPDRPEREAGRDTVLRGLLSRAAPLSNLSQNRKLRTRSADAEIEAGKLAWQIADYTTDVNADTGRSVQGLHLDRRAW
jgi:hypothetical protein